MNRGIVSRYGILIALLIRGSALAHDPFEISSTAYLQTNRLEVVVEMEFGTAVLLAGVDRSEAVRGSEEELFGRMTPQLNTQASGFFQILAGGEELPLSEARVSLQVENHVRFNLTYPAPDQQPLKFNARGLRRLGTDGPYGTTLTVLDMVNQKVLGQPVLFADDSEIEVPVPSLVDSEPPTEVAPSPVVEEAPTVRQTGSPVQPGLNRADDSTTPAPRWWIWVLLSFLVVDIFLLVSWLLRRGRGGADA